jgi:lipopolysaccharide biosynthesis glycosyltransferase
MTGSIHVALTFDDGYWAPAYAVMRSICLASRRRDDLVFHLLHIGLAPDHRQTLATIATEFPAKLVETDLATHPAYAAFVAQLPIRPPFSPVIYARLLLNDILPPGVERIVYLDSDVLVRAPIETLFMTDLGSRGIGAVLDPHRHMQMLGRDLRANADVFDYNFPYFNSGVLLIDRARYAAVDMPGRTLDMKRTGLLDRLQYDQAALNLAFRDNWQPLDWRWNLIGAEPAHEALEPFIVHYTGPRKPWRLLPGAAYHRLYRHVMTNDVYYAYRREQFWRAAQKPFRR